MTERGGRPAGEPLPDPHGAESAPLRFRWLPHVLVALGCAAVAPFTALAWPFALFTGFVIGRMQALQRIGRPLGTQGKVTAAILIGAGAFAMMLFGIAIGGMVAFLIVAIVPESEKRVWMGSPRQQVLARALVVGLPALTWLLIFSGRGAGGL